MSYAKKIETKDHRHKWLDVGWVSIIAPTVAPNGSYVWWCRCGALKVQDLRDKRAKIHKPEKEID